MLSVCMCVGGCLCTISSRTIRSIIASRQLTKSAQSSASTTEDMTSLIICDMVITAPLLGEVADLSVYEKVSSLSASGPGFRKVGGTAVSI